MGPKLKANILFKGKIECITGLHIGGSKDKLEIGGVDSPVLRNPYNRYPYIPGSSLKGRMRALLEYALEKVDDEGEVSQDKEIVSLFGLSADNNTPPNQIEHPGPTPLIVRDAHPDKGTIEMWENVESELLFTEYKPENTINRISSAANPRFLERVVPGSWFDFELVYGVYHYGDHYVKTVNDNLKNIILGLRLIEDHSLGKSGSRGYGKVQFWMKDPIIVTIEDYKESNEAYKEAHKKLTREMLTPLSQMNLETFTYSLKDDES